MFSHRTERNGPAEISESLTYYGEGAVGSDDAGTLR